MALGVLMDIHRLIRVCFGVRYSHQSMDALYAKPLPIVHRPLRRTTPTPSKQIFLNMLIFIQDIVLLIVSGIGVVLLNYYYNQGRFRIYTVLAVLLGFLVYYFTVGKLVIFCSEGIVFAFRSILMVIFVLFSRPIVIFVVFFGKNAKKLNENIRNALAKKRKRVYNKHKESFILQKAAHGFLQRYE